MIQFIQEKNMLRLRVVLLFMATVILPFFRESIDYFVDEDQGKCHFDSEEFKSFLEYVGSYSAWGSRTLDPIDPEDYVSSLGDGKVLAWYFYVRNLSNLKDVRMDFGDAPIGKRWRRRLR